MFASPRTERWGVIKDRALSIVQRSIRRKEVNLALKFAAEIYHSGCAPMLWSRLEICAAEDFSVACPKLAETIREARKSWEVVTKLNKNPQDGRRIVMGMVNLMCKIPTCLLVHCAAIYTLGRNVKFEYVPMRSDSTATVPKILQDRIEKMIGSQHDEFKLIIRSLVQSIFDGFPKQACYFAEQVYLREPQKSRELPSPIDIKKNNNSICYMHLIWAILLQCTSDATKPRIAAIQNIYRWYAKEENSYSERYFLHHAILCLVYQADFEDLGSIMEDVDDGILKEIFSDDLEPPELPEWAMERPLNQSSDNTISSDETSALEFFWKEGLFEADTFKSIDNIFYEEAKNISLTEKSINGTRGVKFKHLRKKLRYGSIEEITRSMASVLGSDNDNSKRQGGKDEEDDYRQSKILKVSSGDRITSRIQIDDDEELVQETYQQDNEKEEEEESIRIMTSLADIDDQDEFVQSYPETTTTTTILETSTIHDHQYNLPKQLGSYTVLSFSRNDGLENGDTDYIAYWNATVTKATTATTLAQSKDENLMEIDYAHNETENLTWSVVIKGPYHVLPEILIQVMLDEIKSIFSINRLNYVIVPDSQNESMYLMYEDIGRSILQQANSHDNLKDKNTSSGVLKLQDIILSTSIRLSHMHVLDLCIILGFRFMMGIDTNPFLNIVLSEEKGSLLMIGDSKLIKRKQYTQDDNPSIIDLFFSNHTIPSENFVKMINKYVRTRKAILQEVFSAWKKLVTIVREQFDTYGFVEDYDSVIMEYMMAQINLLVSVINYC